MTGIEQSVLASVGAVGAIATTAAFNLLLQIRKDNRDLLLEVREGTVKTEAIKEAFDEHRAADEKAHDQIDGFIRTHDRQIADLTPKPLRGIH